MQGEEAAEDIVRQIKISQNYDLDTLIVGRGGGSIEDLWPFNEEIVARAIYECSIPVISAVGHEIDFTIADFVADLRAPTPTGAAEMSVPQFNDIFNYLRQLNIRINNVINNKIENYRQRLYGVMSRNIFINPFMIYQSKELLFDALLDRLRYGLLNLTNVKEKQLISIKNSYILKNPFQLLDKKSNKYLQLVSKLETLSPLLTLKRGYSITRLNGKVVKKTRDLRKKDLIEVELTDGTVKAEII